eukprot:scaffold30513_cov123-Isochrysis_galbana.AAC.2
MHTRSLALACHIVVWGHRIALVTVHVGRQPVRACPQHKCKEYLRRRKCATYGTRAAHDVRDRCSQLHKQSPYRVKPYTQPCPHVAARVARTCARSMRHAHSFTMHAYVHVPCRKTRARGGTSGCLAVRGLLLFSLPLRSKCNVKRTCDEIRCQVDVRERIRRQAGHALQKRAAMILGSRNCLWQSGWLYDDLPLRPRRAERRDGVLSKVNSAVRAAAMPARTPRARRETLISAQRLAAESGARHWSAAVVCAEWRAPPPAMLDVAKGLDTSGSSEARSTSCGGTVVCASSSCAASSSARCLGEGSPCGAAVRAMGTAGVGCCARAECGARTVGIGCACGCGAATRGPTPAVVAPAARLIAARLNLAARAANALSCAVSRRVDFPRWRACMRVAAMARRKCSPDALARSAARRKRAARSRNERSLAASPSSAALIRHHLSRSLRAIFPRT